MMIPWRMLFATLSVAFLAGASAEIPLPIPGGGLPGLGVGGILGGVSNIVAAARGLPTSPGLGGGFVGGILNGVSGIVQAARGAGQPSLAALPGLSHRGLPKPLLLGRIPKVSALDGPPSEAADLPEDPSTPAAELPEEPGTPATSSAAQLQPDASTIPAANPGRQMPIKPSSASSLANSMDTLPASTAGRGNSLATLKQGPVSPSKFAADTADPQEAALQPGSQGISENGDSWKGSASGNPEEAADAGGRKLLQGFPGFGGGGGGFPYFGGSSGFPGFGGGGGGFPGFGGGGGFPDFGGNAGQGDGMTTPYQDQGQQSPSEYAANTGGNPQVPVDLGSNPGNYGGDAGAQGSHQDSHQSWGNGNSWSGSWGGQGSGAMPNSFGRKLLLTSATAAAPSAPQMKPQDTLSMPETFSGAEGLPGFGGSFGFPGVRNEGSFPWFGGGGGIPGFGSDGGLPGFGGSVGGGFPTFGGGGGSPRFGGGGYPGIGGNGGFPGFHWNYGWGDGNGSPPEKPGQKSPSMFDVNTANPQEPGQKSPSEFAANPASPQIPVDLSNPGSFGGGFGGQGSHQDTHHNWGDGNSWSTSWGGPPGNSGNGALPDSSGRKLLSISRAASTQPPAKQPMDATVAPEAVVPEAGVPEAVVPEAELPEVGASESITEPVAVAETLPETPGPAKLADLPASAPILPVHSSEDPLLASMKAAFEQALIATGDASIALNGIRGHFPGYILSAVSWQLGADSGVYAAVHGHVEGPKGPLGYFLIPQKMSAIPSTSRTQIRAAVDTCGPQKPVAQFAATCIGNALIAPAVVCIDAAQPVTQSVSPAIWKGEVNNGLRATTCWILAP